MKNHSNSSEILLKEIVSAYKATQDKPLDRPDQIKHLRYQIARLARVCIEQNKRIKKLEDMQKTRSETPGHTNGKEEEESTGQITALGDII